jgi:hypothetical protein
MRGILFLEYEENLDYYKIKHLSEFNFYRPISSSKRTEQKVSYITILEKMLAHSLECNCVLQLLQSHDKELILFTHYS